MRLSPRCSLILIAGLGLGACSSTRHLVRFEHRNQRGERAWVWPLPTGSADDLFANGFE
jgi:hypothetical protein